MNDHSSKIVQLLQSKSLLITCGTGGVGKTTLSASLALLAARLGRRTLVITIDPAKRLAQSMGILTLGNEPAAVPGEPNLWAIMPDTQRTFEDLLHHLTSDETLRSKIRDNAIFQIFAREFSGTNEYMALLRLLSLKRSGRFDLIILDTPPSRNTLEFLDAPGILSRFFEDRIIQWFVMPANKLIAFGMHKIFGILETLTGGGFVKELLDFAGALFEVRSKFSERIAEMTEVLKDPSTGFVLVTGPSPEVAEELIHFGESVRKRGFLLEGMILNRTYSALGTTEHSLLRSLQNREAIALEKLRTRLNPPFLITVPELARDVHGLEDLNYVAESIRHSSAPSPL